MCRKMTTPDDPDFAYFSQFLSTPRDARARRRRHRLPLAELMRRQIKPAWYHFYNSPRCSARCSLAMHSLSRRRRRRRRPARFGFVHAFEAAHAGTADPTGATRTASTMCAGAPPPPAARYRAEGSAPARPRPRPTHAHAVDLSRSTSSSSSSRAAASSSTCPHAAAAAARAAAACAVADGAATKRAAACVAPAGEAWPGARGRLMRELAARRRRRDAPPRTFVTAANQPLHNGTHLRRLLAFLETPHDDAPRQAAAAAHREWLGTSAARRPRSGRRRRARALASTAAKARRRCGGARRSAARRRRRRAPGCVACPATLGEWA